MGLTVVFVRRNRTTPREHTIAPIAATLPDTSWRAGRTNLRPAGMNHDASHISVEADGTPTLVNVWIPLTDTTPLSSCIYVVPGHRDPGYPGAARDAAPQEDLHGAVGRVDPRDIRALPKLEGDVALGVAASGHDANDASAEVERRRLIGADEHCFVDRRDARRVRRLIALDDEVVGAPGGAQLGMLVAGEVPGDPIRVIGVIVRDRDVRRPPARKRTGLRSEPLRALWLIESLDRQHRVAADNEATIRDRRPVAGQRGRDERPHTVGDALEVAERFATHKRA